MAAKLICRLTLLAAKGLNARMSARAAESEVTGSFSRRRMGASSRKLCMIAARRADLLIPVTRTKAQTRTTLTSAPRLPFPNSRHRRPTKNAMCRPDTAAMCIRPERLMATYSASSA